VKNKKKALKPYRVYFDQVNGCVLEVMATDDEDAREKGYRKWRRDEAHTRVSSVTCLDD
jgi:hypothetical protein